MKDATAELIRQLAAECGVALDRSDPIVVVQAATQIIVRDALEAADKATNEALARHRQELEAISVKWQADAKLIAAATTKDAAHAISSAVAKEHGDAFRIASDHFAVSFAAQKAALRRAKRSCLVAVLVGAALFGAIGLALQVFR